MSVLRRRLLPINAKNPPPPLSAATTTNKPRLFLSSPRLPFLLLSAATTTSSSGKPRAISSSTPTTTTTTSSDSSATSSSWAQFAERASGEWDGFGADFTASGEPLELPENVIPEAFREWGVQVFDWQTQCPALADAEADKRFHYKLILLLPTVGCEADAATPHVTRERRADEASAFAYSPSGSYIAWWPAKEAVAELEHCIVDPRNREARIRVVQAMSLGDGAVALRGVKVFSEQWYGPFRNGEQLGGCAVREAGFAAGDALEVFEVLGEWEREQVSVARFGDSHTDKFRELSVDKPQKLIRDHAGIVSLPKQLWSFFKENGDGGYVCEVGWLLDRGSAATSSCILSKDGRVKEMAVAYETLVLKSS